MKNSFLTVTDQFCGAGGSSIGATLAGAEVRLAMNHWQLAIETHNTNFPHVDHACTDISAVDPRRYPSTDILITSPECTNHSLAKGKPRRYYTQDLFGNVLIDPSEERSRATMWDVPRFAEYHDYNLIVVENVVDAAKWRLWDSWLHAMHALDYEHEVVYFNSMFAFPTPQSRDRLYTVFWKRGNRKPNLDFRPPAPCPKCGVVEAVQTWKRGKWGRYKAQYFYRCPTCHQEVTPFYYAAMNCIDWSLPAERIGDRTRPLKPKTLARIKYGLETYGRQVMVINTVHTKGALGGHVFPGTAPYPTQTTCEGVGVAVPWLAETGYSHAPDNRVTGGDDPYPTATARQTIGLVAGFLSKQYGGQADPKHLAHALSDATGAVTTNDHHALLAPAFLAEMHGKSKAAGLDESMSTVTAMGAHHGLVAPAFIAELNRTGTARGLDEGLMTVTANGNHHALLSAEAFLSYYYGTQQASGMDEPIHTVTGLDRAGLVSKLDALTVDDLTFRMLQPHEIGNAMAFPGTYKVLGTKREKVKQYGNAVTPPVMRMLMERVAETFQ